MLGLSRTNARSASMRSCPIFRSEAQFVRRREGGTMFGRYICERETGVKAFAHTQSGPSALRRRLRSISAPTPNFNATADSTCNCTHAQGVRGLACVRSRHPTRPASLSPSPHTPTDASRLPALHASAIARGERARGGLGWLRRRLALHVGVGGAQATTRRRLLGLGARRRRLGWPASPCSLRAG